MMSIGRSAMLKPDKFLLCSYSGVDRNFVGQYGEDLDHCNPESKHHVDDSARAVIHLASRSLLLVWLEYA